MLPSNPRLGPRGLPSNPHPRSRSTGRPGGDNDSHRSPAHQQRTARSRSSSRPGKQVEGVHTPPPLPGPHRGRQYYDSRPYASASHKSDESTSSATSPLLDRMKAGSGYASSKTSVEEDRKLNESPRSLRQRRLHGEKPTMSQDSEEKISGAGDGHAIWNRVASVASTLTVSVSKAWASQVTALAGEETPPGQESRLTRAMRAYHLEKARDPSDLPAWLFDEVEGRRPASFNQHLKDDNNGLQERPRSVDGAYRSRGLRDIYDAYKSETPVLRPSQRTYNNDGMPSKATDRLKALRDAERNATGSASRRTSREEARDDDNQLDVKTQGNAPRPKVGLPSGPRRRM